MIIRVAPGLEMFEIVLLEPVLHVWRLPAADVQHWITWRCYWSRRCLGNGSCCSSWLLSVFLFAAYRT